MMAPGESESSAAPNDVPTGPSEETAMGETTMMSLRVGTAFGRRHTLIAGTATLLVAMLAGRGMAAQDTSGYWVTWQDGRYQADHPAQNLQFSFQQGVGVTPRAESGQAWAGAVTLSAVGYAGALQAVPAPSVSASLNRIDYTRAIFGGSLSEWYVNVEAGLEQ